MLLDTHVLLWAVGDPDCLTTKARQLIIDESNELVVCAGSAWEIAI